MKLIRQHNIVLLKSRACAKKSKRPMTYNKKLYIYKKD